jgi:hypothetical protein
MVVMGLALTKLPHLCFRFSIETFSSEPIRYLFVFEKLVPLVK